jgi:hypothetical protein
MKDYTRDLKRLGEAKLTEEEQKRQDTIGRIRNGLAYIEERAEDIEMMVRNANAALEAGISLEDRLCGYREDYKNDHFGASGITHALGFIFSESDITRRKVVGMGTLGGGCNGDVSIVYLVDSHEVVYDTDKYYNHNRTYQDSHPLESMDDRLLGHYDFAVKKFGVYIDDFEASFERYLEKHLPAEEKPKEKKEYKVHMFALLGFDAYIEADSREEAEKKAEELFYSEEISWDDYECGECGYEVLEEVADA